MFLNDRVYLNYSLYQININSYIYIYIYIYILIYLFIYLTFNLSQKRLWCQRNDTDSGKLINHQLYSKTKHYFCTEKSINNVNKCAFHNIDCDVKHASYPQLISLDLRRNNPTACVSDTLATEPHRQLNKYIYIYIHIYIFTYNFEKPDR